MVYGRVIGNELRDVPPERLPIWGQRWSGYHAPQGPSLFSTRIFSADRMSEVGPAQTSPTQFELTLTEEDEGEDASSESSQFRSFPLSSPLSIQAESPELTSQPETPISRSIRRSSNLPYDSPKMLHVNTRSPSPQDSTRFSMATLPRQQSGTQYCTSESIPYPSILHHGIQIQGCYGSLENDHTFWDLDCTSTSIQARESHSHLSQNSIIQLQHTMTPHSNPEWQFAHDHTHSSAYPFHPNPSPHRGSSCFLQAGDRTSFIPTTSPFSYRCCMEPLPQQNVVVGPFQDHEQSMVPDIALLRYPTMPSLPPASAPPNTLSPTYLHNSVPPPGPRTFNQLISNDLERTSVTHAEDFHAASALAEDCTSSLFYKAGAWR